MARSDSPRLEVAAPQLVSGTEAAGPARRVAGSLVRLFRTSPIGAIGLAFWLVLILVAIFAPLLGALADGYGVGLALTAFGAGTLLLFLFVRVKDRAPINT